MSYLAWLVVISLFVAGLERVWPAREQPVWRRWSWSDLLHLVFNGHFLGAYLYALAYYRLIPVLDGFLASRGWLGLLYRDLVADWSLWLQIPIALVVIDFTQWCVHNTLHRVSFLWPIHQVHHSVKDGEMDWIVSFRFSWLEPVYYKAVTYLPLVWFGFVPEAIFFHAVFGTLIGHLNHANLTWDYGPLRYVVNSPRMHLYHHDHAAPATGQNFGIIFSAWDWLFGTAHLPDEPPERIGFPGVEKVPEDFFGQLAWPLGLWVPAARGTRVVGSLAGVAVLAGMHVASRPPVAPTPMFGEPVAASQPAYDPGASTVQHARSPREATEALERFGTAAREAGWALPEAAVSARELAEALGSPQLVVLDVRTPERFADGHVPSARLVERADYSSGPVPGVSADVQTLQDLLRGRGVGQDDVVVLMGDGGPEPYRLWWTLREVGGLETRVLDGGLEAWKALGERLAMGPGRVVAAPGDVVLPGGPGRNLLWPEVEALLARHPDVQWVDTRSTAEFAGQEHHPKAARPGRIPGARHLDWTDVLTLRGDAPHLVPVDALEPVFAAAGVTLDRPVLTYCQSGTRSSTVHYALLQAGLDRDLVWNYDGSWAEYSRLAHLPAEVGP
jgi:3-mercaptopyruvate sulfurtransferase SseA/sterol desaturase/sphingolipid hydroxylase (fatty acid hydroxylase superfamily)